MDDFFARVEARSHAWPAHRRDLHWHVLFDVDQVRQHLTDPYRGLTHRPGIEPVAPEWVHMTVLHAGPQADATTDEVDEIIERVRDGATATQPFEVTFTQPTVGNVAIECLGRPGGPVRELWSMTKEATRGVVGDRWPLLPAVCYPHVSLGYATAEAERADRTQMKVWLSDHGRGDLTLHATDLTLVSQWHDRRRIMWDTLARVPLGREREEQS